MVRGPDSPRARWSEDLWNKSNTNILILGLLGPRTIGHSDYWASDYRTLGLSGSATFSKVFTHTHTHTHTHTRTHAHFLVQFNAPVKIISLIETMQISRWVKAGEPRGKPLGTPESRSWLMPLVTQSSTINIFSLCLGIRLHVYRASDYRALGPSGPRTIGPSDHRALGLTDPRTNGPSDYRALGIPGQHDLKMSLILMNNWAQVAILSFCTESLDHMRTI